MKDFIKKIRINYALLAFFAYSVKLLIIEASYADGLVMSCLAALYGYKLRLQSIEPKEVNSDIKKEFQEIKNAMSKIELAKLGKTKKYY